MKLTFTSLNFSLVALIILYKITVYMSGTPDEKLRPHEAAYIIIIIFFILRCMDHVRMQFYNDKTIDSSQ